MATRRRLLEDPPSVRLVKKAIVVFVAFQVPHGLWSGYRAIVQVQRLQLQSAAARLRATARGRPQWLREPPPEVRELPVELRHPPKR